MWFLWPINGQSRSLSARRKSLSVSPDKMSDEHLLVRDDGMADIGVFVAGKWTPILRGVPANHFQLADPVGEA